MKRQICENGQWKVLACNYGEHCHDAACIADACANGQERCSTDRTKQQSCVNGKWQDSPCLTNQECVPVGNNHICVDATKCSYGTTICTTDDKLLSCVVVNNALSWGNQTSCGYFMPTGTCRYNSCSEFIPVLDGCKYGFGAPSYCKYTEGVMECSNRNMIWVLKACKDNTVCENAQCVTCKEGTTYCVSDTEIRKCRLGRLDMFVSISCVNGCKYGKCPECKPGVDQCSSTDKAVIQTCALVDKTTYGIKNVICPRGSRCNVVDGVGRCVAK